MAVTNKALVAVGMALIVGGAAAAQDSAQPRFMTAKALNALVDTMVNGLASTPVPTGTNAMVLMSHRDRDATSGPWRSFPSARGCWPDH